MSPSTRLSSPPLSLSTVGADEAATYVEQRDDLGVQPHGVPRLPPAARLPLPRLAARQRRSYLPEGKGDETAVGRSGARRSRVAEWDLRDPLQSREHQTEFTLLSSVSGRASTILLCTEGKIKVCLSC